jgi:type IV fimbrial biogenesis protein FimT
MLFNNSNHGIGIANNFIIMKIYTIKSKRGFTLIEMLIIIAIISIVALITFPNYTAFMANRALKNAARDIAGDIFAAREGSMSDRYQATAQSATYRIDFNTGANQYTISQCDNNGLNCVPQNVKSPSAFRSDISISSAVPTSIIFTERGTTTAGVVTLAMTSRTSTATITTTISGRTNVNWTLH